MLPILRDEFSVDTMRLSFTVFAVILGIALSTLPLGFLADRPPIHPILLTGGVPVASAGLVCALMTRLWACVSARLVQGLFMPALTTCLAAHLARTIPPARLNVVMGSYVSATVRGGLGGRLLGGWIHSPVHWRYVFVSASVLILTATLVALRSRLRALGKSGHSCGSLRVLELPRGWDVLRMYTVCFGELLALLVHLQLLAISIDRIVVQFLHPTDDALVSLVYRGNFHGTYSGSNQ